MLNNPLLPTAYLAPILYYAIIIKKSDCIIEHHEHFIRQSIRNRCDIYSSNGKLRLTIPKESKGSSKRIIKDIRISYKQDWQKQHWNSIESCYNSSPFFQYYKHEFSYLFKKKEVYLVDFNSKIQNIILNLLGKKYTIKTTSKYQTKNTIYDYRDYKWQHKNQTQYHQVFMEKHGFISNLSILDLLFNLGPASTEYLEKIDI